MVAPVDVKSSSLLTGSGLLWLSILVANLALYLFLYPNPAPATPRGRPLTDCLEPYTASNAAVSELHNHFSTPMVISALRESYRDKWVHFVGDSTLRESYYELAALLRREGVMQPIPAKEAARRMATKHDPQQSRIGSTTLTLRVATNTAQRDSRVPCPY